MSAQIIRLPSGRQVLDTGRVQIGLLAERPKRDMGVHVEQVQTALLSRTHCARRGDMADREDLRTLQARGAHHGGMRALAPIRRPSVLPTIHLDNSLWARVLRAVQRFLPTATKDKR